MMANTEPTPAKPAARLWRNRNFNIFWVGQLLSALGDAFALIALPLLVLETTGSVAQMGLVTGASGVSMLLTGIFAGAIVDRVDRRRLMILCDLGRALLYGLIPLGWWLGGTSLWLIYTVAIGGTALGMVFQVAYTAAIPNLVDHDQITDANGRLQSTFALASFVGPMLAGLVSARFGPAAAIGIDALSFLVSAASLLLIRLRPSSAPTSSDTRPTSLFAELSAGVRFLLGEPVLRAVTLIFFLFTLIASGGFDLFIYYLKTDLGQSDNAVGLVFGVASLGAVLGALLTPLLRRRWGFGGCFLGGMALECVAIAAIGLAPSVLLMAGLAMGMTFGNAVKLINSMSLRQEITPDHLLGRVTSAFWIIIRAPRPIGAAVTTALAGQFGAATVLVVIGGLGLLIMIGGLFTPARTRWPSGAPPELVPQTQ